MTTYACVVAGFVTQTFTPLPDWEHLDPADLFARELFDEWVKIDGLDPQPSYGWRYRDGAFAPPNGFEDVTALREMLLARLYSMAR